VDVRARGGGREAAVLAERVADLDFAALRGRKYTPSPEAWEDEVLYFLMLDRFSDGNEDGYRDNDGNVVAGTTPPLTPEDRGTADRAVWDDAGRRFVGGTLAGLTSKMGYLARLGVTAVWVSPVFRQARWDQFSYHGYGIQNFLDVDERFGTVDDLRTMVRTAHDHNIRVVLDIILNHAGDVFRYRDNPQRYPAVDKAGNVVHDADGEPIMDPRWDGSPYPVEGFTDADGKPSIPFAPVDLAADPDRRGGVWPAELYDPAAFSQRGRITDWDHNPEFLEGDFVTLKNVNLGTGSADAFQPSPALLALTKVYQYWLADLDLDGYRVDTVKHMDVGAARFFASAIHEFAQSIGKERFSLKAEITGGRRRAYETLELTGMDAALGVDDIPDKIEYLVKGWRNPSEYFDLFRNSLLERKDSHVWFRNKVVTLYDDHDQVRKGDNKARFCADAEGPALAVAALALNATTLGIPCIYYGSEQLLAGAGPNDRYLRETMFGGPFGPFQTTNRHVFDESSETYRQLARVLRLRRDVPALRRGRQYLRPISGNGVDFGLPQRVGDGPMRSIVPWSRIFADHEVVAAINTNPAGQETAWVTIDASLHRPGDQLRCIFSTDASQEGTLVEVEPRHGCAVRIPVPAAGFVVYE
jgi:glycosidase